MEDVQDSAADVKGKGKAPQAAEESMDDDSSDESGAEDQVRIWSIMETLKSTIANSSTLGW